MINAYCVDDVTIVKWNGNDSWGEPESGSLIDVKGYVKWERRLITGTRGEEVANARASAISPVTVYLPAKIERELGRRLLHEDRIWIDGESFDRAIIEIRRPKAFSKPHYEICLA